MSRIIGEKVNAGLGEGNVRGDAGNYRVRIGARNYSILFLTTDSGVRIIPRVSFP